MARPGNVLFITLDQLTMQAVDGPFGAYVPTPNMDRLAASATTFTQHFTVTVPCGPARASLLTGLYAMNHRAIRNGAPLARHHATIATEARNVGYEPLLFGYTDRTSDPTELHPEDPDLSVYEGVAPGFREITELRLDSGYEWPGYLREMGYDFDFDPVEVLGQFRPVPDGDRDPRPDDPALYAAEHSETAYLTDRSLAALDIRRDRPWFAHLSYVRPHPPLCAPAPYNRMIDPATLPETDRTPSDHPFVQAWHSAPTNTSLYWGFDGDFTQLTPEMTRTLQAVYLGLLAEVDHHLGRVFDWLETTGQADRTLVILTSDHGEMLGAKGLWGKDNVFDPAYHVPLMIRAPGGNPSRVGAITESVDVMPTVLDWIGADIPAAVDGQSLLPFCRGERPQWRDAGFMEAAFGHPTNPTRFQTALGWSDHEATATILREARWKYVHFGGGVPPMLFDLENDPHETRDLATDPAHADQRSRLAEKMIDRMTERRDRRLTGLSYGV